MTKAHLKRFVYTPSADLRFSLTAASQAESLLSWWQPAAGGRGQASHLQSLYRQNIHTREISCAIQFFHWLYYFINQLKWNITTNRSRRNGLLGSRRFWQFRGRKHHLNPLPSDDLIGFREAEISSNEKRLVKSRAAPARKLIPAHKQKLNKMSFATSSFAGVQVSKAVAAPKAQGRSAVVRVEARRTKASAPSRSAAKV